MADFNEPLIIDLKEGRSDHHARQNLHKPSDRAKKFNSRSVPSTPKGAQKTLKGRSRHGTSATNIREGEAKANGGLRLKGGSVLGGVRDEVDGEHSEADQDDWEDQISTPVIREVPLEDLITVGAKRPRKPKGLAREFDRIRSLKNQSRSGSKSNSSSQNEEEEWQEDWESVNETEGWTEEYSEEWRHEMGELLSATDLKSNKPSYASAVQNQIPEPDAPPPITKTFMTL